MGKDSETATRFRSLADRVLASNRPAFALSTRVWHPPTDIYETNDRIIIRLELAGISKDRVEIYTRGRRLFVRGHRDMPKDGKLSRHHVMEVDYGPFMRVIEFPFSPDMESVVARYRAGFLRIEVTRPEPGASTIAVTIVTEEQTHY